MDELKKQIDLVALSDQEIKDKAISLSDLWMVKDSANKIHGPFDTECLKKYIEEYPHLFEEGQTFNLETENWVETFSIPHFQRRKPALVSEQNLLQSDNFYIQYNDQKNGPYTKDEVQAFLNNGHIKTDTLISLDKGDSWIKLYEHHAFDRRTKLSNQKLPFRPDPEILEKVAKTKEEILKIKEQEEAIIELAYIGHNKTELDKEEEQANREEDEDIELKTAVIKVKTEEKNYKLPVVAASLVLLIGIFSVVSFFNKAPKSTPEQAEVKTKTKSIDNTSRDVDRRPAKNTPTRKITPKKYVKQTKASPRQRTISRPRPTRKPAVTRRKSKRENSRRRNTDTFEQDVEKIDLDDPEIQEELSRQLSGEYEIDGEEVLDEPIEENIEREERIDDRADDYPEDDYRGEEEPEYHDDY